MSLSLFAYLLLVLFMLHEFEEIVRFRQWIVRHEHNPRFAKDMLVRTKESYPSTETVAIMIAEEFVVVSILLGTAVLLHSWELMVALLLVNCLHLVIHLGSAVAARRWVPASPSALLTQIPQLVLLWYVLAIEAIDPWQTLGYFFAASVVIVGNLQLLTRNSGAIEAWRVRKDR